MERFRFEHKLALLYLLIGGVWIIFSDKLLSLVITDIDVLTEIQTYKGWFYVFVTAILFFLFISKHLNRLRDTEQELAQHKNELEILVQQKTNDLATLNEELISTNEELHDKNEIINIQNSELKATVQRLKDTQVNLLHAEKMASLGVLTAGVAHEINNPLNFIMGAYHGLLRFKEENSFPDHKEEVGLLLNALKEGVNRSSAIVKGLNEFSRNSISYEEDCNLRVILENTLTMLHNQIKYNIDIVKHFDQPDIVIKGNVGNLHQVFLNILSNAIQAISEEGTISIACKRVESKAIVEIADTGEGIKPENLKKVADPFFTTKAPGKGTGLGLSITYNIIKEHKGQIEFQSEYGKGTTVKITFPTS